MNYYENIIILNPALETRAIEEAVDQVKSIISNKGGEILKSENLGQKKLAYDLKKQKKGAYILLLFKAPPAVIAELERFYKVFDPLLKFLVIKLKKKQIEAALASLAETENKNTEPSPSEKKEENVQ